MTVIPEELKAEISQDAVSIANSQPGEPKHRILDFAREIADLSCKDTFPEWVLDKEDPDSVSVWMASRNAAIYALAASVVLANKGIPG